MNIINLLQEYAKQNQLHEEASELQAQINAVDSKADELVRDEKKLNIHWDGSELKRTIITLVLIDELSFIHTMSIFCQLLE